MFVSVNFLCCRFVDEINSKMVEHFPFIKEEKKCENIST